MENNFEPGDLVCYVDNRTFQIGVVVNYVPHLAKLMFHMIEETPISYDAGMKEVVTCNINSPCITIISKGEFA